MIKWIAIAALVVVGALGYTAFTVNSSKGSLSAAEATSVPVEASRFAVVEPALSPDQADKVEVLEFFWFGCPHCYAFEPAINEWAETKPDYVNFVREAPPLNPSWLPHSRAFYAAKSMNVLDKFFEPMFHAIHRDKRPLKRLDDIADFASEQGIDRASFLAAMDSEEVVNMIRQSIQLAEGAGLTGVPSIVINGKYRTGASMAGGHEGMIEVINKLAEYENNQ